jgi:AcrR family transcriptional regulator
VQDVTVTERWTQERRRQHTRDLLLDAAEQVFAERGFEGASLEEIAQRAGYTRGAIYKHFGGKEEMFLEANKRFNERYVHAFVDAIDPTQPLEDLNIKAIAKRWRDLSVMDAERFALGAEFNLYVLRNPDALARSVKQRRETMEMIAQFIDEQTARGDLKSRIPSRKLARLAVACSDGIQFAAFLNPEDEDLFEAFIELLVHAMLSDS